MKHSLLTSSLLFIFLSFNSFSQNKYHSSNWCSSNSNFIDTYHAFSGGLVAGLIVNTLIDYSGDSRQMHFTYNFKKNTWRLKKDTHTNKYDFYYPSRIIARFENPNGGRDFFVKVTRTGKWFIDAPKRFKRTLKNKVQKTI